MTTRYVSTFSHKRGRPKLCNVAPIKTQIHRPAEYIDYLYARGEISHEQSLAGIYYRALHFQVHAPLGSPQLTCLPLTSLSNRFKPYRAHFTAEEREEWYAEKAKKLKQLRCLLKDECTANLEFIDDLLLYRSMDETYFKAGFSPAQITMLDQVLLKMAEFFGLI
jgi:hypothetical protein